MRVLSRWVGRIMLDLASGTLKAFLIFGIILTILFVPNAGAASAAPAFLTLDVSPRNVPNKKHSISIKSEQIFKHGFESEAPGAEVPYCESPFVDPAGWQPIFTDWAHALAERDGFPLAVYPYGQSYPVALGTNIGTALVITFTPNPNQSVNLYVDDVQAGRPGYGRARPVENMWFALSECTDSFGRGRVDFRPAVQGAVDPMQRPGCRKLMRGGSLIWTTDPEAVSGESLCALKAGKTYTLIVSPVNPQDGLQDGEHTCTPQPNGVVGCDVGAFPSAAVD